MARRQGEKMGCCELALVVFVLFVVFQFTMLGARVLNETVVLVSTLIKWLGIGIAGAAGIAAVAAAAFGAAYVLKQMGKALFGPAAPRQVAPSRTASHHRQACEWQRGINTTVGRLQKRRWIPKADARRYRDSAAAAVQRVRSLEHDLATLRSLPASDELARELEEAARTLVSRLERTHRALARLLAQSALQREPTVDLNLRDAVDEIESLVAALEDVNGRAGASVAAATRAAGSSEVTEAARRPPALTEELLNQDR